MISVYIQGGLGNQLFQVFALMSYCFDNDKKFVMVKDKPMIKGSLRDFCDNIGKPYILIETTRIEDLHIRINKSKIIIDTIINYYS